MCRYKEKQKQNLSNEYEIYFVQKLESKICWVTQEMTTLLM